MTDATDPRPYRTVAGRGRAAFEVRGSRFIGHVAPADTVADAEAFVDAVCDEHGDATHKVPAYRVPAVEAGSQQAPGGGMLREYSSDAGEPSGSAGAPALNVLQQEGIERVAAVVTRYYGGTNLGVGGLARAYSRAVTEAVTDAGVVEEHPHERLILSADYDDSGTVRSVIESAGVEFDADYGERAVFEVRVPVAEAADLRERLRSATGDRVDIE